MSSIIFFSFLCFPLAEESFNKNFECIPRKYVKILVEFYKNDSHFDITSPAFGNTHSFSFNHKAILLRSTDPGDSGFWFGFFVTFLIFGGGGGVGLLLLFFVLGS